MRFLLAGEAWVPLGDSQFLVEKWVSEDHLLLELGQEGGSNDEVPWDILPYYRVLNLNGIELMDTTDWSDVVGFLQVVLGEEEIPDDFSVDRSQLQPFDRTG